MIKTVLLALIASSVLLTACAHPNPRGALDEMVGTVGGAYRNISISPTNWDISFPVFLPKNTFKPCKI